MEAPRLPPHVPAVGVPPGAGKPVQSPATVRPARREPRTCFADRTSLLVSAQRQDTAAVRMAAAVLPRVPLQIGGQDVLRHCLEVAGKLPGTGAETADEEAGQALGRNASVWG